MWIKPDCGACLTGNYTPTDLADVLACTSPICDHTLHTSDLVDADVRTIHDGILWIFDPFL
ncbi:hypothetical protein ACFWBI_33240 [Streptomyces sp. NPDC059982]|uniref:hypothetical protein n=1 Tax=unclassified Streptomyces TaxID=2593676 RepID=UPI0036AF4C8C